MFFSGCGLALAQGVPARSVPILLPSAIAYDSAGNLYIAETQRHAIRRVDALGNITSFAGDGTQGFSGDGGPAAAAQLNSPQGVAVDGGGNVYISDSGNNRVRRVDAISKTLRTVAGDGVAAFTGDGGPAASASLNLPRAICLDSAGKNLFIADTRNHRVRHVDLATGTLDTFAGDGVQGFSGDGTLATSASLDSPDSIALDPNGNLYLADTHNQRLRRISVDTKIISTVAGPGATATSAAAGPPAATSLSLPRGLAADSAGNIYIADSGNHRLLRVDHTSGLISIAAGSATQGFAGDAGPATLASLDSPRAIALSPGGLVSIADAGNQRVRQLLADPAPTTPIQTIAGLGVAVPEAFSLSGPPVTAYGSGTLTASLEATPPASGQVTLLDAAGNSSLLIGVSPLANNVATFSLSQSPAGQHRFTATYAGDATHPAAHTSTIFLTITQLTLRATPTSATMVYGSATPALTGALEGLLPQDTARVAPSFTTTSVPLSSAGIYPISAALTGDGAANYLLQPVVVADLVITQANSVTLLRNDSTNGSFTGTIRAQVNSATSGTPSGVVTLLDSGAVLATATLSAAGSASFSALPLTAGTHTLNALYSGEQNFLPSSSSPLTETISNLPPADFAITATEPSSQTLLAGSSTSYTLSVQMTGAGLSSPIALSVSGLPAYTKAAFTPGYVPPGSGKATPVTLTITSLAASALYTPAPSALDLSCSLAMTFPIFGLLLRRGRPNQTRRVPTLALTFIALFLTSSLIGCGARINTAGQTSTSTQSYTLTVTGTATDSKGSTLAHSANIVLKMNSPQ